MHPQRHNGLKDFKDAGIYVRVMRWSTLQFRGMHSICLSTHITRFKYIAKNISIGCKTIALDYATK